MTARTNSMKHKRTGLAAVAVAAALGLSAAATQAYAQSGHSAEQGQDHGTNAPKAGAVQHAGGMNHHTEAASAASPMGEMDHGSMQGGSAPPDARDPHEYSGGYARNAGKYALPPSQRLRMSDEHSFGSLLVNRLERVDGNGGNATAYEAQAWFGRTYDRLVIKAEGERARGELEHARTELLWSHAIANYWNTQLGLRYDSGMGPNREWLAIGVQGLAPYWFEVDATAYIGSNGRTALNFEAEYELLLTQRLILQPRIEVDLYGKRDEALDIGRGVSEGSLGLRLRYEITRQFAPYVGIEWATKFGQTADLARATDERTHDMRLVAGLRFWF